MSNSILAYEEWLVTQRKYDGSCTCFVYDCDKPALYEGGDCRYYCGMCEKHASMENRYRTYLADFHIRANERLSAFEAYLEVKRKRDVLEKRIKEALTNDGPEPCKIKQDLS